MYQFQHSKWHGLHFWDLLLPAFMLIAGTSMAFSYARQQQQHGSWNKSLWKTLKRSFWLLFFGILIYSVLNDKLNLNIIPFAHIPGAGLGSKMRLRHHPASGQAKKTED